MEIEKYLSRVPDSKAFMTVEGMEASTDALVAAHPDTVKVETVGHSRGGPSHPLPDHRQRPQASADFRLPSPQ